MRDDVLFMLHKARAGIAQITIWSKIGKNVGYIMSIQP